MKYSIIILAVIVAGCTKPHKTTTTYTCTCAWSRYHGGDTFARFYYRDISQDSATASCNHMNTWLTTMPDLRGTDSCKL